MPSDPALEELIKLIRIVSSLELGVLEVAVAKQEFSTLSKNIQEMINKTTDIDRQEYFKAELLHLRARIHYQDPKLLH